MSYAVDQARAIADANSGDTSGIVDGAISLLGGADSPQAQRAAAAAVFGTIGSVFGPLGSFVGTKFGTWFANHAPPAVGSGVKTSFAFQRVAAAVNQSNLAAFADAGIATDRDARNAWAAAANSVAGAINGSHAFGELAWGGVALKTAVVGTVLTYRGYPPKPAGWMTWAYGSSHSQPLHDVQSMATRLTRASLAAWAALAKQGVSPTHRSGGGGAGGVLVGLGLAWLLS